MAVMLDVIQSILLDSRVYSNNSFRGICVASDLRNLSPIVQAVVIEQRKKNHVISDRVKFSVRKCLFIGYVRAFNREGVLLRRESLHDTALPVPFLFPGCSTTLKINSKLLKAWHHGLIKENL